MSVGSRDGESDPLSRPAPAGESAGRRPRSPTSGRVERPTPQARSSRISCLWKLCGFSVKSLKKAADFERDAVGATSLDF
jgi:hypothetical protein